MIGPTADTGACEARSETALPCGHPAATSILGVRLCERCAREQEAYFAVGELTEVPRGSRAGTTSARDAAMAPRSGVATGVPTRMLTGVPAGLRQRLRETAITGVKVSFLVAAASASILASAACGGAEQARGGSAIAAEPKAEREASVQDRGRAAEAGAQGNATDGTVARAGGSEARAGGGGAVARAGGAEARAGDGAAAARASDAPGTPGSTLVAGNGGEDAEGNAGGEAEGKAGPQNVTLVVEGDPGTGFSGVCSVGGKEKTLDGWAPERYGFEPGGEGLECEIRKEDEGALEFVVTAGSTGEGVRSVQRIGASEGTVRFALSNGGVSSSLSSVSVNQTAEFPERSSDGSS